MRSAILTFYILFFSVNLFAQEEIDASKPTNFYSQLINNLDHTTHKNGANLTGYRGELLIAPNDNHLVMAELPLLYNNQTEKFGLGDIRLRYFYLPYKNYEKFFGAFGPSIDVYFPTGSFENGLGPSSWTVVPGITAGLMAADWIQFFPILSYQHITKPETELIPDDMKEAKNGVTFQVVTPVIFNDQFFMQITPIFQANSIQNERQDRYVQEVLAQYAITPKMQFSAFFRGNFQDDIYNYRLGYVAFF